MRKYISVVLFVTLLPVLSVSAELPVGKDVEEDSKKCVEKDTMERVEKDDKEIAEMVDMLAVLDMLESFDVLKDMDVLAGEETNEEDN